MTRCAACSRVGSAHTTTPAYPPDKPYTPRPTIFDDVMMWCLLRHRRRLFVTTEMNQQLLRPALAGQPLCAEARIAEEGSDRMVLKASLAAVHEPGRPLAQGAGTFVPLPPRLLESVPPDEREEIERLFAEFAEADAAR